MRRERRLDVTLGAPTTFDSHFRDYFTREDGTTTVIHEYELSGAIDTTRGVVIDAVARPRVLPWPECSGAVESARRLSGAAIDDLRDVVSRDFKGVTTCTHLNDQLRSLADLGHLATRALEVLGPADDERLRFCTSRDHDRHAKDGCDE
jgi:hypothetical protein